MASSGACHLDGWPAPSVPVCAPYVAELFHGKMGTQPVDDYYNSSEDRPLRACRYLSQRLGNAHRTLDSSRELPDHYGDHQRSRVSGRAPCPHQAICDGSGPKDERLHLHTGCRDREPARRLRSSLPPRKESVSLEWQCSLWSSADCPSRGAGDDVSGIPGEAQESQHGGVSALQFYSPQFPAAGEAATA